MKKIKNSLAVLSLVILFTTNVFADDVTVTKAKLERDTKGTYTFHVTLLHEDSGWEHYADKWQVLDSSGNVIGERVLLHPHEDEQPFERSTSGIKIPDGETTLSVRAHDLIHGWNDDVLEIDLSEMSSRGRLTVWADD